MKAFDTAFHEMMNTEICFDENRKRMNQLLIRQNENNYAWFCIGESGIKKRWISYREKVITGNWDHASGSLAGNNVEIC